MTYPATSVSTNGGTSPLQLVQGGVAFLPFIRISLKSLRKKAFEFEPKTVGEHILRERLIHRLSQAEAATRLGVDPWTVLNWEKGHTKPPTKAFPAIIRFLGYDPNPVAGTLAERLKAKRRQMGWTIRQAANALGVDESSWGGWERSGLTDPLASLSGSRRSAPAR